MIKQRLIDILERWRDAGCITSADEVADRINETIRLEILMQEAKGNKMSELLKATFTPRGEVKKEEPQTDKKTEFEKRALESIGGSMVFIERKKLYYDPLYHGDNEDAA